ncbi:MAG TPA: VWA domain-containing protein [Polyangia bacterium]|jgi:hypothetical protein
MTLAAGLLSAPLWLATAVVAGPPTATATTAAPATQKIAVDVRGPVALVEVTRPLEAAGAARERLLDVALPEHAALVDVAFAEGGKWRAADVTDAERASRAYVDRLASLDLPLAREPVDDGASYRFFVVGAPQASIVARYRFAVLPEAREGRRRIRFPAALERTPLPADVALSAAGASDVDIAGARAAHGRARGASTRGAWEISWVPRAAPALADARLTGSLALAKLSPGETLAAVAVEAKGRRPVAPPPNVLLLVDRSRSVGLPGLAAERDLAGRLLEALPPSTRFDALFFDRHVRRLFPASRPATREALGALDAEMVPDRMQNGTDLPAALRAAGAVLRREAGAFGPRALLALVTDGALPEGADGAALEQDLGATPGVDVGVATFVVRPPGDDAAPAGATRALSHLAALHGGVMRELAASELEEALPPALAALARGGDVAEVRLFAGGGEHALAPRLAPGEGRTTLLTLAGTARGRASLVGTTVGAPVRLPLRAETVDADWLRALTRKSGPEARLCATGSLTALVQAVTHAAPPSDTVRGSLDRTVVRNTLSLAFMPRARACYLGRTAATPALRDLAGRVRLAIDLTRGEVGDVVVQSSTLNHPGIEACLRDGAFALEVPRALRSDAPSTAILNLVFRPRTPERHASADEAALGEQIDLIIEEAHREEVQRSEAPPTDGPPTPDRSMIPTR